LAGSVLDEESVLTRTLELINYARVARVRVVRVDGVVHAVLQKIRGGLRSINTYSLVGAFMGCNSNSL
jgi:hypothetical protein